MTHRVLSLRLLAAASLSVLVHAALMSGRWLEMPQTKQPDMPLQVGLVRAEPKPPPLAEAGPAPRARPARARTRTVAPAMPPVAAAAPLVLPDPEPAEMAEEPAQTPATEPPSPPVAEASPAPQEHTPVKTLPRKGRIAYTMYYGDDGFTVGKTVQSWEVNTGGYKLGSVSETTGIVELFRAQRHIYLSEGRFTPDGLQPEKFFMSRTRRGRTEAAQALFDWAGGVITLGRVPHQRGATLVPESQDIVSFMYQLALSPPAPGRIRLPVTNGSRFETYELDVLDEEDIETPLGMLRALPVRQVPRPGAESIAIWLAVDYRHLPVRIRFFDREGKPMGEQVVNDIQISDE